MRGEERFQTELKAGKINPDKMVARIRKESSSLDAVFQELSNRAARVKFGCSKVLVLLSAKDPELLYPKTDKIFDLLGSENRILKWNAIMMLGNLAAVDRDDRVRSVLPDLCLFLTGGELITANHAIAALGKIGRAFPEEQGRITARLLEIENANFETGECRNIAIGKAILALAMFLKPGHAGSEIIDFIRRQTDNTRKATANKARAFLKQFQCAAPSASN